MAVHVCEQARGGDKTPIVIASTASPFKFAASVLPAAFGVAPQGDDFAQLNTLSKASGLSAPDALAGLQGRKERFLTVVAPADMKQAVAGWLSLF